MPTTNPVPSYDPTDLLFNSQKLDEVVNGTSATYTDRRGVQRRTLTGLEDEFPNAQANAVAAAAAAVAAADSAVDAANEAASAATAVDLAFAEATASQASRVAAEAARDAAFVNANVYADTAAGLAATTNGQQFQVVFGDTIIRYRNNSGAAVEVAQYPSANTTKFIRPLQEVSERIAQYGEQLAYSSGGSVQTGWNTYTVPASGDSYFNQALFGHEIGSTVVDVVVRVTAGTPSAITIDQRNSSGTAIAGTTGTAVNEGNGAWARRGITLDAAFAMLRVRVQNGVGSPNVTFESPIIVPSGMVPVAPARRSDSAVADMLAATAADQQRNLWEPLNFSISAGSGATLSGRKCVMPIGSKVRIDVNANNFLPSDTVTLIFHASGPHRIQSSFDIIPVTGIAGGAGTILQAKIRSLGNGWYVATRANCQAASGAQAAQFQISLDNRTGGIGQALTETLTLTHFWLGKNVVELPSMVTAPAAVSQALVESGALTLWVDPAGSDSNAGTQSAPLATVQAAVSAGAGRVMIRKSATPHRLAAAMPILSRRIELIGYVGSGDTQTHAKIWSSENLALAQFTATADTNVYYRAMTTSPGAIWESTSSGLVRFGRVQTDPLGVRADFAQPESSEGGVQAGSGRWWWGSGSAGTGLYLRPTSDSFTGRSYECPLANAVITLAGSDVVFDGVEISLGRTNVVTVTRSTVVSRRSRFMRSGTSDGVAISSDPSHWLDEGDCLFAEAGDDGIDTNGGGATFVSLGGSKSRDNIGDGVAPHGNGQTHRLQGMHITANGKQGFVSVGTGTFEMVDCDLRGNAETDLLIRLGALTGATTVRLKGCDADETEVTATTASTITAEITGHRGPLQLQANATVRGHRNVRQGNDALRVDGGDVTAEDFYYSGGTDGVDIRGGSLTLRTGQILRNTTGIRQSGGMLTLDSAAPVNVYGNTTQFSGVSAEDQAKTLSIAAV